MPAIRDRILAKKDELGLKMMEESARGGGYHLVFALFEDAELVDTVIQCDSSKTTVRDRGQEPVTSCDRYQSPVTKLLIEKNRHKVAFIQA